MKNINKKQTLNEEISRMKSLAGLSERYYLTPEQAAEMSDEQPKDNDLVEFDVPEWSLSALINGDISGLNDEDEVKLNTFTDKVVQKYGNANFMLDDIEGKDNLGFKHTNDIDNLGNNVFRLYLKPSL